MSHCTLNLRFHKLQTSVLLSGRSVSFRKYNKFFCKVFFSYIFSMFSNVVHELEPKKWVYEFLVTSGCLLSRKIWWAVLIGSFWPKNWSILQTRMNQRRVQVKMNFDYFQWQTQIFLRKIFATQKHKKTKTN